ncbi:MAG: VCBS repeat-containing protein [Planctomycetota bacterium]
MRTILSLLSTTVVFLTSASAFSQEVLPFGAGFSVARMSDVNNDGFPDYVSGDSKSGRVCSGLDGTVLRQFFLSSGGIFFNGTETSCAPIGDIDHDGVEDVALSMPGDHYKYYDPGWVMAFSTQIGVKLWQKTGSTSIGSIDAWFGRRMIAIGDTTGDGIPELLVGSAYGVEILNGTTGAPLGYTTESMSYPEIAAVGDVTNDGVPDVLVGLKDAAGTGLARILDGRTLAVVLTIAGDVSGALLGTSVAAAGDIDLDGRLDILTGAPGADLAGTNAGTVYVVSSALGTTLSRIHGWWPGDRLGASCAAVGDLDQDGFPEIAAGTSSSPTNHQGYVLLNSSNPAIGKHLVFIDNTSYFNGARLTPLGDINLDGKIELAVSSQGLKFVNFAPGVLTYSFGTSGCHGGHLIDVNKRPSIGTSDFEIRCNQTPNDGIPLLLVSDTADIAGTDLFNIGILMHVGITGNFLAGYDMTTLDNGRATVTIPIPFEPQLIGTRLYAQAILPWYNNPCFPSTLGLSSSAGLALIIQP